MCYLTAFQLFLHEYLEKQNNREVLLANARDEALPLWNKKTKLQRDVYKKRASLEKVEILQKKAKIEEREKLILKQKSDEYLRKQAIIKEFMTKDYSSNTKSIV